ncbi:unnamed protein product [Heligmosomoides polygyrus]|uniref:Peptidase S1 domain-containing protein n=1 Tax=Heligmosomoides polygyrus TaxID=6339 RepID=A0A3P7Z868_HELPZ|nr:unnamed protein product [Heligmosomoides polygyrus]
MPCTGAELIDQRRRYWAGVNRVKLRAIAPLSVGWRRFKIGAMRLIAGPGNIIRAQLRVCKYAMVGSRVTASSALRSAHPKECDSMGRFVLFKSPAKHSLKNLYQNGRQVIDVYFIKNTKKEMVISSPPGVGICAGDEGGPLFYEGPANISTLIGITAVGNTCQGNYKRKLSGAKNWTMCDFKKDRIGNYVADVRGNLEWICEQSGPGAYFVGIKPASNATDIVDMSSEARFPLTHFFLLDLIAGPPLLVFPPCL